LFIVKNLKNIWERKYVRFDILSSKSFFCFSYLQSCFYNCIWVKGYAVDAHIFDERNDAVKRLVSQVINTAHSHNPRRKVGICGQAPSDFPEFAEFLVECGIDSISLNPDTVIKTRLKIAEAEERFGR